MRVLDYTTDKAPDLPNDWYALLDIADEKDAEDESKCECGRRVVKKSLTSVPPQ